MSFLGAYSPQDKALFGSVECPDDVDIPLTDIHAYKKYSMLNWVYDKVKLCEALEVPHGFAGVEPAEYPVFQKPIHNLEGRGQGTTLIKNPKDFKKSYSPGAFWMPAYTGEHWSLDHVVSNGEWKDYFIVEGHPTWDGMFDYWEYKGRVDENLPLPPNMLQASIKCTDFIDKYLKDYQYNGIINFECIGQNIIEIHLRISPQMAALYGEQNIKQLPGLYSDGVWKKDPGKKKPPGGYVLPLFVEDSPKHGYEINEQVIKDIASDENMRHISLEYDGEKDLDLIAHPPGGYYIGSITVEDLDQGKEERQRLLDAFIPRA